MADGLQESEEWCGHALFSAKTALFRCFFIMVQLPGTMKFEILFPRSAGRRFVIATTPACRGLFLLDLERGEELRRRYDKARRRGRRSIWSPLCVERTGATATDRSPTSTTVANVLMLIPTAYHRRVFLPPRRAFSAIAPSCMSVGNHRNERLAAGAK